MLREADFPDARGRSVRFERCDLTGASFAGARVRRRPSCAAARSTASPASTGLRGAALEWPAIVGLAGTLAGALGLRVLDDDA